LFGQEVKLGHLAGGTANAPTQEGVELHTSALAYLIKVCHVEGFGKCYHGHGRLHPHFKGVSPVCFFWVDFLFHLLSFLLLFV
jgi:hypothetical protein